MKVDREKALAEWSGNTELKWSASQLAEFVCGVLETQSHLWERGADSDAYLHGPALAGGCSSEPAPFTGIGVPTEAELSSSWLNRDQSITSIGEWAHRLMRDYADRWHENRNRIVRLKDEKLCRVDDARLAAEARVAELERENERLRAVTTQLQEMSSKNLTRAEAAEAELGRCSKACDEAQRKADDHRRQRDELKRKAAEDAALIKSLQEQLADANAKLERLRGVLKPWPEENIVSYGRRVRDQAAGVLGGNHG